MLGIYLSIKMLDSLILCFKLEQNVNLLQVGRSLQMLVFSSYMNRFLAF